jgi:hypothetical protein
MQVIGQEDECDRLKWRVPALFPHGSAQECKGLTAMARCAFGIRVLC